MIAPEDGAKNSVEDWYFLENQKRQNKPESPSDGNEPTDPESTTRKRTKDFIEHELHAMSTLSLYDDSLDKVGIPGEVDKWVFIMQVSHLSYVLYWTSTHIKSVSTRSSLHVKDELISDLYGLNERERFL